MRRPIGVKFCTVINTKPSFIMPVKNFGGLSKKLGAKTCKIWPDFGRLQSSAANISGTKEDRLFEIGQVGLVDLPRFFPR